SILAFDKSKSVSRPTRLCPPSLQPAMRLSTLMSAEFNFPLIASAEQVSICAGVRTEPRVPGLPTRTVVIAKALAAHISAASVNTILRLAFIAIINVIEF
ncbi:MAG: hypothetical protein ACI3X4_07645, partial [Bacteroidaceae bacterium]